MPWSQTSTMDQRTQFIADYLRDVLSVTELCELYGVSRKTGYKWIDRYIRLGPAGLEEGSRRPQHSPNVLRLRSLKPYSKLVTDIRHGERRSSLLCCISATHFGICRGVLPCVAS